MKKRAGHFEKVPVAQALRAAIKNSTRKAQETKTEPYAIKIRPEYTGDPQETRNDNGRMG